MSASSVVFALSEGQGGAVVLMILLAAASLHVAEELLFVAACWRLSVDLMPADSPGEYQGVFAIGQATAQMLAPAMMTTRVVSSGGRGWLLLGAIFALAALPALPATRWALQIRAAKGGAPQPRRPACDDCQGSPLVAVKEDEPRLRGEAAGHVADEAQNQAFHVLVSGRRRRCSGSCLPGVVTSSWRRSRP